MQPRRLIEVYLATVELATFLALAHFNDGAKEIKELGIDTGTHCCNACAKPVSLLTEDVAIEKERLAQKLKRGKGKEPLQRQ